MVNQYSEPFLLFLLLFSAYASRNWGKNVIFIMATMVIFCILFSIGLLLILPILPGLSAYLSHPHFMGDTY